MTTKYRISAWSVLLALLTATLATAQTQTVKVALLPVDGSRIHGTAILTPRGTDLFVSIVVQGANDGAHFAHFHRGTCEHVEAAAMYLLNSVRGGRSTTRLRDISLQRLVHGTYSVLIHAGSSQASRHAACGTISGA
jgi:hypothetical protein